jgi:hypothetical protein
MGKFKNINSICEEHVSQKNNGIRIAKRHSYSEVIIVEEESSSKENSILSKTPFLQIIQLILGFLNLSK